MLLLPHAASVANRRGMGLPGLYSGRFLFGAVRVRHETMTRQKSENPLRKQRAS